MDFIDVKFFQLFDDKGCCFMIVEFKFWIGVQVVMLCGYIICKFSDVVQNGYCQIFVFNQVWCLRNSKE